jgi:hypothetical protein
VLSSRSRPASYSSLHGFVNSLTVLLESTHCPSALSNLSSISRCDIPPTYISTFNRFKTSLVVATCRHTGDRYGSSCPRICGTLTRNTPSAVFSVPFSYPLRDPSCSPRAS